MRSAVLKVVERPPFYRREEQLFSPDDTGKSHSLHYAVSFPDRMVPELANTLISRFSVRGEYVLDPFCGTGTVGLESALLGRIPVMSDVNVLALRIAQACLFPADISEITLRLQLIPLNRPVDSRMHNEYFEPFYDIRTFCELVNLQKGIRDSYDRVMQFIEVICMSLLHGHSSGYFSAYTFPQVSLLPEDQKKLNSKRRQVPDYRAILPRILRRSASLLRDGIPSVLTKSAEQGGVNKADSRDLFYLNSGMIDAIVTSPPVPGARDFASDMWLKLWFTGSAGKSMYDETALLEADLTTWRDFMNASLLEFARVTKTGGRAVLEFPDFSRGNTTVYLEEEVRTIVEENLARYWDVEGIIVSKNTGEVLSESLKARPDSKRARSNRVLILRRR